MNTRLFTCALAAAALALGGCNFAPRYQKPAVDSAASFKEAVTPGKPESEGWRVAQPNERALGGAWWELYHDSELDALEERVAASNQTVSAAAANYRAAHALVAEAESALLPTVGLQPSVVRSRSSASVVANAGGSSGGATVGAGGSAPATTTGSGGGGTGPRTLYTLPIDASYELDLWGSVRNSVAQSSDSAEASAANYETALLSGESALAQAYFSLRATDEQRRILDTTLNDYQASLHLVRTLYNNGLASEEDMAEADTQLDSAEAQATDLGVARAQFEHAIAVLIGVAPSTFSVPFRPFSDALPVIPVGVPSELLERRPDIAAAERQVQAANAAIGIARAAYFPTLTLNGSAGYESASLSRLFDWPNRIWSIGPTLVENVFDGGLRRAENAQARAEYDATVAEYRQAVLTAFQSVEDDLATLRVLAKEVEQQHRAAVAAKHTVELSVVRYQNGVDSYVNVITAQNAFLTNRIAELQVELRQVVASLALINNLGGGWDTARMKATEDQALHPPGLGNVPAVPPENGGPGIANPPPLLPVPVKPEEILKQDEEDMAPQPPK